jgi:hypothetical protein
VKAQGLRVLLESLEQPVLLGWVLEWEVTEPQRGLVLEQLGALPQRERVQELNHIVQKQTRFPGQVAPVE